MRKDPDGHRERSRLARQDMPALDALLSEVLAEGNGEKAKAFVRRLVQDATDPNARGRAQLAQMVWDRMVGPVAHKIESEALDEMVKRSVSVNKTGAGKRAAMPGEEGEGEG